MSHVGSIRHTLGYVVHEGVHLWVYAPTHTQSHVVLGAQCRDRSLSFSLAFFFFPLMILTIITFARLAGQYALGIYQSPSAQSRVSGTSYLTHLLKRVLGFQTQVPMLAKQVLCLLNHLPCPMLGILDCWFF